MVALHFPCAKVGMPVALNHMHFEGPHPAGSGRVKGTVGSHQLAGPFPVRELIIDPTSVGHSVIFSACLPLASLLPKQWKKVYQDTLRGVELDSPEKR